MLQQIRSANTNATQLQASFGYSEVHDTQDPKSWLSDHMSSVNLHVGNKETAMQCLQLQLTGAARVWLSTLSSGSIRSWEELAYSFIQNLKGPSKRPASIEELRACTQGTSESIRSYILC